MIPAWQSFLEQRGATVQNGRVEHFGDPASELQSIQESDLIVDLSHLGLVRASGEDARDFLQGQFSNDVRQIDEGHCQLNSYNSPKGRMLASFRLFQRCDDFYLQMPQEVIEPTVKRLGMFILMSKVVLEDVNDQLVAIGLSGPNTESLLSDAIPTTTLPTAADHVSQGDGITVIRLPGLHPRFELIGEQAVIQNLWERLSPSMQAAGADAWTLLDIRSGIPMIHSGTVEAFVPQMVNLHLINGVNFKKGCYPGQEVVARMQYLGKLKRRMYRSRAKTDTAPMPGDKIYAANTGSSQGAGNVVMSAPSPEGGYEMLIVADIATLEQQALHLESEDGPELQCMDLPYTFEQAQSA